MVQLGMIRSWLNVGDDDLFLTIVLLVAGLVLIIKGGDWFVDSSAWIAEISGIPKLIVGATVVSFATTLPELLVSSFASAQGKVDTAIGNAVGSVTANIGLIMAIGIIFMAGKVNRKDYILKSVLMLGGGAFLLFVTMRGEMSLLMSIPLILVFLIFMFDNVKNALADQKRKKLSGAKEARPSSGKRDVIINILKFIGGVAGIIIGADLLSDNGAELARQIGVDERIIAVTVIAIGTSLPELVTTITAIVKKENELSFGNIIGANVIDIALILPVSAAVSKGGVLKVDASSAWIDIPVMLGLGAIALVPMLITGKFRRWQGIVLLLIYVAYVALMFAGVIKV